jgi:hypothetical protein
VSVMEEVFCSRCIAYVKPRKFSAGVRIRKYCPFCDKWLKDV